MTDTFFDSVTQRSFGGDDVEWFTPTELARGPWDPDACHAGPPTAMMVRCLEQALPAIGLVRVTVDLVKPVPVAGFFIQAEVTRAGRAVGGTTARLVDADGIVRATATGIHIAAVDAPVFARPLDNSGVSWPRLADSVPGEFPLGKPIHGMTGFRDGVSMRYPVGQDNGPGATTLWMSTVGLLPDEEPSPFQRICPLSDCGNAFSRHLDPESVGFINPDLTIALHRAPEGEWLGMRSVSQWQPTGVGLAQSSLFDEHGPVGTALQTMLLRPR